MGISLTRGFSCRSGRNVEKSLLIITYVVGIALCRALAADRYVGEERVHELQAVTWFGRASNNPCLPHPTRPLTIELPSDHPLALYAVYLSCSPSD